MKPTIEIINVTKHYGKFKALDAVNMKVNKGDIYGLVGKNGAGKTTLFKAILGLSDISDGSISILGSKSTKELLKARNKIGFLIGQNFYDDMNAEGNIHYYRKLKGINDTEETKRVLEIVGLDGVNKTFKNYSMGMRQRLGIANAILGNPEILILDEPINGLDPQGIKEVRDLLKLLNEKYKMTMIVSSHILSELDLVAHRFGIIDGGMLIKEIDHDQFEENKQETIILRTNDLLKTQSLLEKQLEVSAVLKENHLEIRNSSYNSSAIVKYLVDKGFDIEAIYEEKESLEAIYFKLTEKGESHV